jgi:8-oxo-dGTP diphosphatase
MVRNERGERLLAAGPGPCPAATCADFALALAIDLDRILLVRNTSRQVLELPGGWIDAGESAAQAAARELLEETGYTASDLQPWYWIQIQAPGRVRPLTGQVFQARGLRRHYRHAPDQEIESLHWITLPAIPPGISAIDAWLIQRHTGK